MASCCAAPVAELSTTGARLTSPPAQQRDDLVLGWRGAYFGAAVLDRHVEFATHAEASRQINSRLDREAGAIDERAMVVGLERVEVGAGAMHLAADRMAGAMDELLAEAGALDDATRGAVGLLAADRLCGAGAGADELDRGVARRGDDRENARVFLGHSLARIGHPGQVRVDTVRARLLGPQIEQHQVAAPDRRRVRE